MIKYITQEKLIETLQNNPLNIPVFFNEVNDDVLNGNSYIFLYNLGNTPITHDNTAVYISNVQIQIYSGDIDTTNALKKYILKNFICDVDEYKEDIYNVATLTTQLFVNDWA